MGALIEYFIVKQLAIVNCPLPIVNKTSGAEADLLLIGFLHRKQIISEKRVYRSDHKAILFSVIILRRLISPYLIRPRAVLMLQLVKEAISLKLRSA